MCRISNILLLLLMIIPISSLALSSDQKKTAYLNSDRAHYNRTTHISTYIGHINFKQGTTHLKAEKLVIYDNQNTNKVYKIVAFGQQAHYSTLPDGKQDMLNAEANTITYYPAKKIAILHGDGEITQDGDKLTGPHIEYNINKQTILVTPAKKNLATIILQP